VSMRHDAVIFDLFGTLVDTVTPLEYEAMLRAVASALGADHDAFQAQWRATIQEREAGTLGNVDRVLTATAEAVGTSPSYEGVTAAKEAWLARARSWLTPRYNALQTIEGFRSAGYKVGLLSNCSGEVPPLWQEGPLATLVDAPVFSSDVGMMKPDPQIYRLVCFQLEVAPERCLFVGDGGARELTGARKLGMEVVLLRVPGEEHTWFDAAYRQDALEWEGATVTDLSELPELSYNRDLGR
jgi:putative hydrolase of the HAD superfamily